MTKKLEKKLTFGDLSIGDNYVIFPKPGNIDHPNQYQSGLYIFKKVKDQSNKYFGLRLYDTHHTKFDVDDEVIKVLQ